MKAATLALGAIITLSTMTSTGKTAAQAYSDKANSAGQMLVPNNGGGAYFFTGK